MHTMNKEMQACIENCRKCHEVCLETIFHCLQKGGQHASSDHILLLSDCAQICQTSADFMSRGSSFHAQTCGICAEICEQCAEDCESMADDQHMKVCAKECRRCAESCQQMSQMVK